ncbi:MAG: sulfatase, partial [Candidatus Puniceispirillaceae bacterium]
DHYHYFEDGGATYHTRYASWDFIRGQESDPWVAMVTPPLDRFRAQYHPMQFEDHRNGHRLQGMINRTRIRDVGDFPVVRCVDSAIAFLEENDASDNWLLQMETFDPHEPFHAPAAYRDPDNGYEGPVLDWPRYKQVDETPAEIAELRANYAALVRLCDDQLGRLLDHLDETDGWQDTAIILTTDHGFLLSEHDWWAKNRMPFYNEVARIPLMIHHPHHSGGRRISALTQTIDLMPTLLDLHGRTPGPHVQGRSLLPLVEGREARIRDVALYGIFGGAINATDGQHTYFRYPQTMESHDLFEYTLMPAHNRSLFTTEELAPATLHRGFDFTSGAPVLRLPARADAKRSPRQGGFADTTTVLYDLATDPGQTAPFRDAGLEARMCDLIRAEMTAHEAPAELYARFDLT